MILSPRGWPPFGLWRHVARFLGRPLFPPTESLIKRALQHLVRSVRSTRNTKRGAALARASFEALESRVFLSGTVLASVANGNLIIRGDAEANAIILDRAGLNADQVRVAGASGTLINDGAEPVILDGVTRNVLLQMGAGDDGATVRDMSLPGNLSVNGSAGANAVAISNLQVAGNLNVLNGSGLGTATIANSTVGKNMAVASGAGGQNVSLLSVEVQRNSRIASGKGTASLTIDDSIFRGATRVTSGKGADVVRVDGPPTLFEGPVVFSLGGGDDALRLDAPGQAGSHPEFAGKVQFLGGAGADTLHNFDAGIANPTKRFKILKVESTV